MEPTALRECQAVVSAAGSLRPHMAMHGWPDGETQMERACFDALRPGAPQPPSPKSRRKGEDPDRDPTAAARVQ